MFIFSGRRNRLWAHRGLVSVAAGLCGAALLVHVCAERPPKSTAPMESGERNTPRADATPDANAKQAEVEREASTMKRLHELRERDPATELGLALAGNLQFPRSPDAPERGWIICRSLVDLQRFPEAVAEARVVVEQYPNTPWALDIERHLLVNPMSDPSERGYGHRSELE